MKNGRPSAYNKDIHPKLARALAGVQLNRKQIAERLGISLATYSNWKKRYGEFSRALDEGFAVCNEMVENALFRRAVGYEYDDTHITHHRGEIIETPVKKHLPPNVDAIKQWQSHQDKDRWGDNPVETHVLHKTLDRDGNEVGIDWSKYSDQELRDMQAQLEKQPDK